MTRVSAVAVAALFLTLFPSAASPQAHAHPGAASTEQLGTVHFATSCRPAVAPAFDRAVALLHSFEFGAAIAGFDAVLAADSTCAMAHWGIALARWGNPMAAGNRSAATLQHGTRAVTDARRVAAAGGTGRVTGRERGWIDAVARLFDDHEQRDQRTRILAYETAMRDLVRAQPADTEAVIFHAVALAASASPGDKTYANQRAAGSTLEALWARMPDHPGLAHYIIHSYDHPALADRARAAAQRYATIAPSAAHALHMPSHTFTRVGMWTESIATNERSMRAALGTGAIAEALHAADYLVYAQLQLGRDADAKAIIAQLPPLAARFDATAITGAAPASAGYFALAAIPARWALERGAWAEAAALAPTATAYPYTEAMTYFARALGAARTSDTAATRRALDSLSAIHARLAAKGETYWTEQVAIQQLAAAAWLDLATNRAENALVLMRDAVRREDATEKNAVTPGPLAPARELLGDMLVQLGRAEEARAEYRAVLRTEPGRRRTLAALDGTR